MNRAHVHATGSVWTSDCNDALERQIIQRGMSMLVPLGVIGAHIGPFTAHTTGRRQSLSLRGATAMFGHMGVEWNLLTLRDDVTVDNSAVAHGVFSTDKRKALMCYAHHSQ